MNLRVYHYPKCGTCRKALKWLDLKGHTLEKIDIVEAPPSKEQLKQYFKQSGLELKKFFNTSGELYKSMGMKDKIPQMSEDELLSLLSQHGKLIKRPIVTNGERVTVGFNEEAFEEAWPS